MLTIQEITAAIDYAERWTDGGAPALVAMLRKQAAQSEAWAAASSYKSGKRKTLALLEAKELRNKADQIQAQIKS